MKQNFDDVLKDNLLGIETTGRDDRTSDDTHSPYEPTEYAVLDRIIKEGYVSGDNFLVDFGCGKGRVPIYMADRTGCRAVGIDMESRFIQKADENLLKTGLEGKISFFTMRAEEYRIPEDADRFYFFNPFSYEIFKKILSNISDSYYEAPREMLLMFYYPSDEYVASLMTEEAIMFDDEIDCRAILHSKDPRDRVLVFEVCG